MVDGQFITLSVPVHPCLEHDAPEAAHRAGPSATADTCLAGLAFGGTAVCSCRVTGVDGSYAKRLTVESYI